MRRYILLVVCLCLVSLLHAQNRLELVSPNGELKVSLNLSDKICLLYTSPSPRDRQKSRMPSSA